MKKSDQSLRRVVLARVPAGLPAAADFRLVAGPAPRPQPGDLLVRVLDLSVDRYLRGAIAGRHLGSAPVRVGDLIPGRAVYDAAHRPALTRLLRLYADGRLSARVDPTPFHGLAAVPDAIDHLTAGRSVGKVAVDVRRR